MTDKRKVELQHNMEDLYEVSMIFAYNHMNQMSALDAAEILKLVILTEIDHSLKVIAECLNSLDSRL